ncbi:probable methyltransferase PMT15 [Humulus lupulus]|uniref:probable methyltransferase PMT15 n=1 Tax=Humulus lupulus TaxID=3486 RepID=UPI002B414F26|nr:probable methyltransferase PMT15 [Humulus lupulus]
MAETNRLGRLALIRSKRLPSLYFLTSAVILCSICYFVGFYQHYKGVATSAASVVVSKYPCSPLRSNLTAIGQLDFEAHHRAEDLQLAPPAAPARRIPACAVELSEHTPCEDVKRSLSFDREKLIYRERHCPAPEEKLKCRIPAPYGYRTPFRWPESRGLAWYANVPHKELTVEKRNQNWVHYERGRFKFPGGGTMFPNGADAYIDDIGKLINLKDGSIRTAIDTGCGVASWGAYLLSRDILAVSFAPRDTHEAQVQFALERGVPALIGILASIRLPYPSRSFDMAHCSRCLIPWGQYDGLYLIEVDRILRPGGYWILSGPPINWENHWKGWNRTREDLQAEQNGIEAVAKSLCWKKLKQKNDLAIWQKPTNHVHCRLNRKVIKKPQFCQDQDPDKAWYTKMEECLTPLPSVTDIREVAGGEVAKWPERLTSVPPRISSGSLTGITPEIFMENTELWKKRVAYYKNFDSQLAEQGRYRNLLDMNSYLGGFAAALINDPVWVMNVVPVEAETNTLGVIYERGLIGTFQNWCEAMSTYPRTYDFIHADSVFSLYQDRCEMEHILLEIDRILRPQGSVIFRDDVDMIIKVKGIMDTMQYTTRIIDHEEGPLERVKILLGYKQYWTAPSPASISKRREIESSS